MVGGPAAHPEQKEVIMPEFNPLQDLANFLGSIAKGLPPLPPLPHQMPQLPRGGSLDDRYVNVSDHITDRQFEKVQEERAKKGIIGFRYE